MHSWTMLRRRARICLEAMLIALGVGAWSIATAMAQPAPDAGEQPIDGPIIYDLVPGEGELVVREDLARAGATIETRRDVGIESAAVFINGRKRPSALMGPTRYLQGVSAYVAYLQPGIHTIRVIATDTEGRTGGYSWSFAVLPDEDLSKEAGPAARTSR